MHLLVDLKFKYFIFSFFILYIYLISVSFNFIYDEDYYNNSIDLLKEIKYHYGLNLVLIGY